jgi:two-component system, LytTR family, sensor kinase
VSKPVIGYNKIKVIYAGWWLLWIGAQAYVLTVIGFDRSTALTDASIAQLVLAVAGYAINTSMSFYIPSPKNALYVLSWSIILAGMTAFLQRWFLLQVLSDVPGYPAFLDQSLLIRSLFDWLMITMIAILTWFWVYIMERQENEQRKEDASRLAREAELSNLRMQLQPHFLFNSLNSISALIVSNPEQARTMIQQLSDFLRGTVKKGERQLVNLEEELQHLQLYLAIEKVRFGHRLTILLNHEDESLKMKLPSLLLQPIVENAIKFGLYDTVGEITIAIAARSENSQLVVEVKNPFDPTTAQPRQGTGFGLNSIRRRLYLLYFQNDLLSTQQEENTFITTIKIPQQA